MPRLAEKNHLQQTTAPPTRGIVGWQLVWTLVLLACPVLSWSQEGGSASATNSWPMLAHDAGRSGATPLEIHPPFRRQWYRLFTDEGLMSGVQPIIAHGKVFLGTLRGNFYALDSQTGRDAWRVPAGGAVLQSAAWSDGNVIFGSSDGMVHCLRDQDGSTLWEVPTGAALWNAPVVGQGMVLIGGRDQQFYAIDEQSGSVRWTAAADGPFLGSPALDLKRGRVYAGAEDMHVYAFRLQDGAQIWRSPKLPGVSLRGYHPVVAPDGSVLVTTAPGVSVDTFQGLLLDMAKEIFGDFASWRHSNEANAVLREENFALMQKPETYFAQLNFIRQRLTNEPAFQTFFVLHSDTGQQKFVAPIVYSESMNGPGAPAVVTPDGKVVVKFQALLRSRYEHYSPFLNVGELNTATGDIRPLMDQTKTYGWYDSLLLVHDEQSQLSVAGPILINTHQDNVNGFNMETREGFLDPFCRNLHEPKPGEALAIWARLLRNEPLPPGKEWLARGTAVYGGGSVLDVPVSIAGDSFYYLPTHELNAGAALISYRMDPGASMPPDAPLPTPELTPEETRRIQDLPWDWDTLESRRLDHVLTSLTAKVPGTRQKPLTEQASQAVANITDAELDPIIWEARSVADNAPTNIYLTGLREDLTRGVRELITESWQPWVFPSGKFPEESYRFFLEPTETVLTLAWAYPHLEPELQEAVRNFVQRMSDPGGILDGPVGRRSRPPTGGQVRTWYDVPDSKLLKFQEPILRQDLARLYPLWAWAQASGDWSKLERDWSKMAGLVEQRPNPMDEDCRNGHLAGLIAYCRVADHLQDAKAREAGMRAARAALRERLQFELAHTRGGVIWPVPKMRSAFSRWHFLTPEVGRALSQFATPIHSDLMARYVDYHRPTWWLAWNVETLMRNECPYEFPTTSSDIFAARSLILQEPIAKLALYLDRPWCRGDEFYIQKLALVLQAATPASWQDVRGANKK